MTVNILLCTLFAFSSCGGKPNSGVVSENDYYPINPIIIIEDVPQSSGDLHGLTYFIAVSDWASR